jgi:hypothetical protein
MNSKLKAVFLLVVAAIIGVFIWHSTKGDKEGGGSLLSSVNQPTVLKGVITSEKENFFRDERVKAAFIKNGFDVQVTRMTSDKIVSATTAQGLDGYGDFVFPSSASVSEKVKSNFKSSQPYNVFYSPMIIATWQPIVNILKDNNVIKKSGTYDAFDMESYLGLVQNGTRWKDLKNSNDYSVNKLVLVYSSDSRYSGSAKMYVSLASYILNQNNVVGNAEDMNKVLPTLKKIVQAQGNRESSSSNMTSDYVSIGRGKVPMMFTYESEFLVIAKQNPDIIKKGAVFVYPTPTVYSKHVMVVINPKAQTIVDLMKKDPELKKLASEYGFRIEGDNSIVQHAKTINVSIPETVVDVIDPPAYDVLDSMAELVEKRD